jgi:hypothetical protein
VSQPNVNMYRPGSVTCPALCQLILLTTDQFPAPPVYGIYLSPEKVLARHHSKRAKYPAGRNRRGIHMTISINRIRLQSTETGVAAGLWTAGCAWSVP